MLYYPYGASSSRFKNIMASNLMMWEAIRFGKKHGATLFDMWGSLGPNPSISDPWYGFHRFKQGYNPRLIEFIGSFDLVINPKLYKLYNLVHKAREIFLKLKR
jgi:lipid II:glycine glycyltransferase (peptidoglycan interpeptide bridge formation enzyme)